MKTIHAAGSKHLSNSLALILLLVSGGVFAYVPQQSTTTIEYYGQGTGSFEYKTTSYVPIITITNSPPVVIYNYSSVPADQYFNNPPYLFNSGSDDSYVVTGNLYPENMDPVLSTMDSENSQP